jgi:SAM-dependent methyltransferase
MEGYQPDLAYIHNVGFGAFAERSAPGLLQILADAGITSGLVVDLGCGSGIWAKKLLDAGYEVLGVDQSAALLRLARKNAPGGKFIHKSFLDVDFPPCAAVTALGEVFNYLFDPNHGKKPLAEMFRRVYDALRPGGVFIFDVAEPGRGQGVPRSWFEGDDWAVLTESQEDGQQLTRNIISFRRQGKLYRRQEEIHRLQLYDGRELALELRQLGFRAKLVRGYGAY